MIPPHTSTWLPGDLLVETNPTVNEAIDVMIFIGRNKSQEFYLTPDGGLQAWRNRGSMVPFIIRNYARYEVNP